MHEAATRILDVEDDRTVAEVVTLYLEREGYEVEPIMNRQAANREHPRSWSGPYRARPDPL